MRVAVTAVLVLSLLPLKSYADPSCGAMSVETSLSKDLDSKTPPEKLFDLEKAKTAGKNRDTAEIKADDTVQEILQKTAPTTEATVSPGRYQRVKQYLKDKVAPLYGILEKRYGKKTTRLIVQLNIIGTVIPVPTLGLWLPLPVIAVAEFYAVVLKRNLGLIDQDNLLGSDSSMYDIAAEEPEIPNPTNEQIILEAYRLRLEMQIALQDALVDIPEE